MGNEVRDARGIGIWRNDRSMCMIERNTVIGTRPDAMGHAFGVLASFQSEANLWKNELGANPVASAAITQSEVQSGSSFSYR